MPHAAEKGPGHECNYRGYKNYDGTNGNTEWRALFRATQKLGATGRIFPAISFWRSQAAPCPETANHGRIIFLGTTSTAKSDADQRLTPRWLFVIRYRLSVRCRGGRAGRGNRMQQPALPATPKPSAKAGSGVERVSLQATKQVLGPEYNYRGYRNYDDGANINAE